MAILNAELSSGVKVTGLYSSLIRSSKANIAPKTKEALIEENKASLQNTIKTAPDNHNASASLGKDFLKVAFEDEKSGQLVSLNLSLFNMFNLLKNFKDKSNYFVRDDGIIRLNGDAQNFISGWFANLAYDLNFLDADKDKNGLVEGKELFDTFVYQYPYFQGNSINSKNITELSLQGGKKLAFDESTAQLDVTSNIIEGGLNHLISYDKNADNKITFVEFFGGENMLLANAESSIIEDSSGSSGSVNLLKYILEQLKKMLEELEKMMQDVGDIKQKALEQGLTALTSAELEQFKSQEPAEYERLIQENPQIEQDENAPQNENLKNLELAAKILNSSTLETLTNSLNQQFLRQVKEQDISIINIKA